MHLCLVWQRGHKGLCVPGCPFGSPVPESVLRVLSRALYNAEVSHLPPGSCPAFPVHVAIYWQGKAGLYVQPG